MHWSDKYIGMEYKLGKFDCSHLAELVQKEQFGVDILLPKEHEHGIRAQTKQLELMKYSIADPVKAPQEGDAVLMKARACLSHVGIYCMINSYPFVLHAMRSPGHVVRHRMRDLPRLGFEIEGYYRWKK